MYLTVAQAADRLGITPRGVQKAIQTGTLRASRIGSMWLIDEEEVAAPRHAARPMSSRVAWAFLDLLADGKGDAVSQPERSRLRAKQRQLADAADPSPLLRAWLARRAPRLQFRAWEIDLVDLHLDRRLLLSGVSDLRARRVAGQRVEAYVAADALDAIRAEYMLLTGDVPNVILRPVAGAVIPRRASLAMVAADLSDWKRPAESAHAAKLVRRIFAKTNRS